jgi:hypothetical protein
MIDIRKDIYLQMFGTNSSVWTFLLSVLLMLLILAFLSIPIVCYYGGMSIAVDEESEKMQSEIAIRSHQKGMATSLV